MAHGPSTPNAPHYRDFFPSGLVLRVLFALLVSWMILMAFFVTSVVSH